MRQRHTELVMYGGEGYGVRGNTKATTTTLRVDLSGIDRNFIFLFYSPAARTQFVHLYSLLYMLHVRDLCTQKFRRSGV